MAYTVVFLWISGALLTEAATKAASLDLEDFGASRDLSFVPVPSSRPVGLPTNDPALVLSLEGELEQARTALSALEEARAAERLSRVEAELLAHPYLPQATFLMGECLALQAQAARQRDPARALLLEERRQTLEGVRAPAFGDGAPQPAPLHADPLEISGLAAVDELELDGRDVTATSATRRLPVAAGLHHVRVFRNERLIFASFVSVESQQRRLSLAVPPLVPCSADDLHGVAAVQPLPHGVRCERWAQVRPEPGGGVAVALCQRDHCGSFTSWRRPAPAPFRPIAAERAALPGWAGFALAGATALVASGIVLWQAGAFDRGRPTASSWQYGGLNPQALRF